MLYQNLIMGDTPYVVRAQRFGKFQKHRHSEIEIIYCLNGSISLQIENEKFEVSVGEAVLVGSMLSHEINESSKDSFALLLEIGPIFLREHFGIFSKNAFYGLILKNGGTDCEAETELRGLFEEIRSECRSNSVSSNLIIIGDLYKICASINKLITGELSLTKSASTNRKSLANIDKALELAHYNYREQVSVDEAAKAAGYSKSNFCKSFKKIIGESFHSYLNNYRVKNACHYLKETDLSITQISELVGFTDSKTFCRIFKTLMGVSPTQFRNG